METEEGLERQEAEVTAGKHVFILAREFLHYHLESRSLVVYEMSFALLGGGSA